MPVTINAKEVAYERANPGRDPPLWRATLKRLVVEGEVVGEGESREAALAAATALFARAVAVEMLPAEPVARTTTSLSYDGVVSVPVEPRALINPLPPVPSRDDAPATTEAQRDGDVPQPPEESVTQEPEHSKKNKKHH